MLPVSMKWLLLISTLPAPCASVMPRPAFFIVLFLMACADGGGTVAGGGDAPSLNTAMVSMPPCASRMQPKIPLEVPLITTVVVEPPGSMPEPTMVGGLGPGAHCNACAPLRVRGK